MSVGMRIALGTVTFFNGFILFVVGVLAFVYVDGSTRVVVAGLLWFGSGAMFSVSHHLKRADSWE